MNEDDDFTIIDETFGVREASDASETEEEDELQADKSNFLSPVQRGMRGDSRNSPDRSSCQVKEFTPSGDQIPAISSSNPTTLRVHHDCNRESEELGEKLPDEYLVSPLRCLRVNDLQEQVSPVLKDSEDGTASGGLQGARSRSVAWELLREKDYASLGYSSRRSPKFFTHSSPISGQPNKAPGTLAESTASDTKTISGDHQVKKPVRVELANPRDMTQEAAATAVTHGIGSEDPTGPFLPMKAIRLRVLPGAIVFGTLVPWFGDGSLSTVEDLEREVQRQLDLRQRVRLDVIQVEGAGTLPGCLRDASDGGTVTVRPLDVVLVRARSCVAPSAGEPTGSRRAASVGDRFVPLPLRCSWLEAVEIVKAELGVDVGCRAKLQRAVDRVDGMVEDPSRSATSRHTVASLSNGDILVLASVPVRAVSPATCPMDDPASAGRGSPGVLREAGGGIGAHTLPHEPSGPSLYTPVDTADPEPAPPVEEDSSSVDSRGTEEAAEKLLLGSLHGNFTPEDSAVSTIPRAVASDIAAPLKPQDNRCSGQASDASLLADLTPPNEDEKQGEALPMPKPRVEEGKGSLSTAGAASGAPPASLRGDPILDLLPGSPLPPGPEVARPSTADDPDVAELVGMGFDRDHVIEALRVCNPGESRREAAISLLLEPQVSTTELPRTTAEAAMARHEEGEGTVSGRATPPGGAKCPICLSDTPQGEAFTVDCKEQHVFCLGCLYRHCGVQLLEFGLIPACPMSSMGCEHELSLDEVERVFLLSSYSSATSKSEGEIHMGRSPGAREERALDACRTLLTRRGLEATGAIPCVISTCGNWMVPVDVGQRVQCSACLVEFCRRCKRSPYHYAAHCDDVVRLAREWAHWLSGGKAAFLKATAAQSGDYQRLLKRHEERKLEHERAVREAERVRDDYDKMERWKETRCRLCPGCGRVIEKISGCDSMICGMDAHGGNTQNGCGTKFTWTLAPRYVGDRGVRKEMPFTEAEPQSAARVRHFIATGIGLRCDRCHGDIVGPLFRCINCPSFVCCLQCQDAVSMDPRHVHHVFEIVGKNEAEGEPSMSVRMDADLAGGGGGARAPARAPALRVPAPRAPAPRRGRKKHRIEEMDHLV